MVRVLVVDDEKNVLTTLKIGLKRQQFQVYEAQSGPEALLFLERQPCDVLVSDIRMVPMDGYALAQAVRAQFPHMGIILMSAYGVEESQYETMERLSCSRLIKPFSVEDLIEAINQELSRGKNGRLLVLGDAQARKAIREVTVAAGYAVEVVDGHDNLASMLGTEQWQGLLVDGESLDDSRLQSLNTVDRLAPTLPVILLARKGGMMPAEDSVVILDKEHFLADPEWAGAALGRVVLTAEGRD